MGLQPTVIYKWFWDQRKKRRVNENLLVNVMQSPKTQNKAGSYTISATDGYGKSLSLAEMSRASRRSKNVQD